MNLAKLLVGPVLRACGWRGEIEPKAARARRETVLKMSARIGPSLRASMLR